MVLGAQPEHLRRGEPRVGEHADLRRDVGPARRPVNRHAVEQTQGTNQSRAVFASSALRSFARMSAMRPDMTTKHSRHRASNSGSASTASTTRAPNAGGFEYNARASLPKCPRTAAASLADEQDATTAPALSE